MNFWVHCPLGSGEKVKNIFSRWQPWLQFGIFYRNDLSYFDLQVTPMLPTKFRVKWPFSSDEEVKRFSWWPPSWISDQNDFSYFWSTSHPDASYQFSNQMALWFRKISEKRVSMATMVAILDFQSKQLSYFRSTSHPIAFYQVLSQLAFQFRRRSKNRLSRWLSWWPSWVSYRDDFSYFWSTSNPNASYLLTSLKSTSLSVQEKKWKIDFQDDVMAAILDFQLEGFSHFQSISHPDVSYQVSSQLAFWV